MPRRLRVATGGYAYHVLNRGVGKMRLFAKERDFEAFEEVIAQTKEWLPMRLLAWCVMSTHWHFVLWPEEYKGRESLPLTAVVEDGTLRLCHDDCELPPEDMRTTC